MAPPLWSMVVCVVLAESVVLVVVLGLRTRWCDKTFTSAQLSMIRCKLSRAKPR